MIKRNFVILGLVYSHYALTITERCRNKVVFIHNEIFASYAYRPE